MWWWCFGGFRHTEMAKERRINEQECMVDIKNEHMTEIYNLKQKGTLEASEKKMTAFFDGYMGSMLRESRETLAQMDLKTNTLTDRISRMLMNTLEVSPRDQNATTSPPLASNSAFGRTDTPWMV
jgi:hypothetical protein